MAGTPTNIGTGLLVSSSTTTVTITGVTAGVGDLVIVIGGSDGNAMPSSVTDTAGNTYTADHAGVTDSTNYTIRQFSSVLTSALSAGTITVTAAGISGNADKFAAAIQVTGTWDSSRVDKTSSGSSTTGAAWDSGTTATTTTAAEVVVGCAAQGLANSGTAVASTPGAPNTEIHDVDGGNWIHYTTVYQILSATGTPKANGTWTGLTNKAWGAIVVTYKEAAGGAFSLDLSPGSYAVTGVAAGVLADRLLSTNTGSYALTGVAASPVAGRVISAAPGSYAVTGVAASLLAARLLSLNPGSYGVTGVDATLFYQSLANNYVLSLDPGSYAITGVDASLLAARVLSLAPGSYVLSGVAAQVVAGRVLSAAVGSYGVAGVAASLLAARNLLANPGAYGITGMDAALIATLLQNYVLSLDPGSYAISGKTAGLVYQLLSEINTLLATADPYCGDIGAAAEVAVEGLYPPFYPGSDAFPGRGTNIGVSDAEAASITLSAGAIT